MKRFAYSRLLDWKNSTNRKPLVLQGARQVGKTWLLKEFGEKEYVQIAYINFESSLALKNLFMDDFDIDRILTAIQIECGIKVVADDTLIILDEIQEAEKGITSLKYFYEKAPQYHVVAAGSQLGISLHRNTSFPVGKVDFLKLYPMNFLEFILAINKGELVELLQKGDWKLISMFKSKYIELLKQYYYVGGMPEAVLNFANEGNFEKLRSVQNNLLLAFENDFSKHAPVEIIPRIRMIWQQVGAQLSKENKKFIYGALKPGARAKDYELALSWLTDTGLMYKTHRISKPGLPLSAYIDFSAFKLYLLDVGLLAALTKLNVKTLLEGHAIFTEFKGALTEQYVLQQLKAIQPDEICYWASDTARAEVDFVIQSGNDILPLEVKAEENLQSKSLKSYQQKFNPRLALRTTMADYKENDRLINIPLYALHRVWGLDNPPPL